MRRLTSITLLLCLLLLCISCQEKKPSEDIKTSESIQKSDSITESQTLPYNESESETDSSEKTSLIYQAHRGLSKHYPENTIPAFQGAIDEGFKIIELDPAFTKDGKCVLMHDKTMNRTCRLADGSKLPNEISLSDITYSELLNYDAGIFEGEKFKGTKVPLLSEACAVAKAGGVTLKLDNKIRNFSNDQLEVIFKLAEEYPDTVTFTCKSVDFAKKVIARLPGATIHYDGTVSENILKELKATVGDNTLYIWISVDKVNESSANLIKQYGILGIWTVKDISEVAIANSFGAEVIETNGEVLPRMR